MKTNARAMVLGLALFNFIFATIVNMIVPNAIPMLYPPSIQNAFSITIAQNDAQRFLVNTFTFFGLPIASFNPYVIMPLTIIAFIINGIVFLGRFISFLFKLLYAPVVVLHYPVLEFYIGISAISISVVSFYSAKFISTSFGGEGD